MFWLPEALPEAPPLYCAAPRWCRAPAAPAAPPPVFFLPPVLFFFFCPPLRAARAIPHATVYCHGMFFVLQAWTVRCFAPLGFVHLGVSQRLHPVDRNLRCQKALSAPPAPALPCPPSPPGLACWGCRSTSPLSIAHCQAVLMAAQQCAHMSTAPCAPTRVSSMKTVPELLDHWP